MAPSNSPPFVWVPGQGPDPVALDRMRRAFPKPNAPMGEAWFMGSKRQMYPRLAEDLATLPDGDITKALEEIASGTQRLWPIRGVGRLVPLSPAAPDRTAMGHDLL